MSLIDYTNNARRIIILLVLPIITLNACITLSPASTSRFIGITGSKLEYEDLLVYKDEEPIPIFDLSQISASPCMVYISIKINEGSAVDVIIDGKSYPMICMKDKHPRPFHAVQDFVGRFKRIELKDAGGEEGVSLAQYRIIASWKAD